MGIIFLKAETFLNNAQQIIFSLNAFPQQQTIQQVLGELCN